MIMAVAANTSEKDENFYVFLCFGQSNMEGYPGIPESEKGPIDPRFSSPLQPLISLKRAERRGPGIPQHRL